MSVDVSGVDNLTSSSNGATSLAVIKSAVDNLNSGKADVAGQAFTGNITAPNLSGSNSGDQTLPTDATLSTSDVTTNNSSTSKHGFLKKLSNLATDFMNGQGAWASVKDSDLAVTDITTNNSSTAAHGFLKKLSNVATQFMDGTGNWSTPASFAFNCGASSYSGITGSQNIAHGLGVTPKYIRITAFSSSSGNFGDIQSIGVYNGSATATVISAAGASTNSASTDTTNIVSNANQSNNYVATATVNGTNITLAWTKTGSPGGVVFTWEAIG